MALADRGIDLADRSVGISSAGHSAVAAQATIRSVQLLIGIVCMVMIANLQYGWTLFVNPMDQKYHWGRAAIQVAFTIFVLTETWLVPVEGWLVDRWRSGWQVLFAIALRPRRLARAVLGTKALGARPGFEQRAVNRKVIARQQPFSLGDQLGRRRPGGALYRRCDRRHRCRRSLKPAPRRVGAPARARKGSSRPAAGRYRTRETWPHSHSTGSCLRSG